MKTPLEKALQAMRMTAGEFLTLPANIAARELIDGQLVAIPGPVEAADGTDLVLAVEDAAVNLGRFLDGRHGHASDDVRLWVGESTVLWPRITVDLDQRPGLRKSFLELHTRADSPPAVVVEPSFVEHLESRLEWYGAMGIAEIWVIDPLAQSVTIRPLQDDPVARARQLHGADPFYSTALGGHLGFPTCDVFAIP